MAKFPSQEELKRIRKKLARVKGSSSLPLNASPLDRAKYKTCEKILAYRMRKNLTNRELAKILGCGETRVSEITHYRIEKFTLDRLITFAQYLDPKLSLKVA